MFGELWAQLRNEVKFAEYSELRSAKQINVRPIKNGLYGSGWRHSRAGRWILSKEMGIMNVQ